MGPLVEIKKAKALATIYTLRIIDLKDKQVMADLRRAVEARGHVWLACEQEGSDVRVVTIGSNDNTLPDIESLEAAVIAAGMQLGDK